jgi:glycerophosphoryl diester phosphodiesterase
VRHENEISTTTDVAARREFADRRTTKIVDGATMTGWFTEDFTWDELSTLRCRERLPKIRPACATFDDAQPILRLTDVLDLVRRASLSQGREIGVVLEIKHATYFAGIGLDFVPLVDAELRGAQWADGELPLVLEAFESTVLTRLRERGIRGSYIYLIEAAGRPYDMVAAFGKAALTYRATVEPVGLDSLVGVVDGISVDKRLILAPDKRGRMTGPTSLVDDAHARGLRVFTWTCRPENMFLVGEYRIGRAPDELGDYEAEWDVLRSTGLDGVFVDHADLGVAFFRS